MGPKRLEKNAIPKLYGTRSRTICIPLTSRIESVSVFKIFYFFWIGTHGEEVCFSIRGNEFYTRPDSRLRYDILHSLHTTFLLVLQVFSLRFVLLFTNKNCPGVPERFHSRSPPKRI